MKTPRFAAIILAAGLSSRMKQFKPLLPLGKATITDHVIATFKSVNADVFLVVGYRRDDIVAGVKEKDITIVYNPDYEKEMFTSVQAGVRQLRPEYSAFFILPVDIPLVKPTTIRGLIAASKENPGRIIYPTYEDKRGHPPLLPDSLIPALLGRHKSGGLKAVLKEHETLALEVPVKDSFILEDIDTPEDYQNLLKHYRESRLIVK
jgi:molybdenum cofactor cytidylyltransferase